MTSIHLTTQRVIVPVQFSIATPENTSNTKEELAEALERIAAHQILSPVIPPFSDISPNGKTALLDRIYEETLAGTPTVNKTTHLYKYGVPPNEIAEDLSALIVANTTGTKRIVGCTIGAFLMRNVKEEPSESDEISFFLETTAGNFDNMYNEPVPFTILENHQIYANHTTVGSFAAETVPQRTYIGSAFAGALQKAFSSENALDTTVVRNQFDLNAERFEGASHVEIVVGNPLTKDETSTRMLAALQNPFVLKDYVETPTQALVPKAVYGRITDIIAPGVATHLSIAGQAETSLTSVSTAVRSRVTIAARSLGAGETMFTYCTIWSVN